MIFDINRFTYQIICDSTTTDALVETISSDNRLELHIVATKDRPKFIELNIKMTNCIK